MNCPIDGTALSMTEIRSLVVDYCPKCRGVWLTRDNLNKLVEPVKKAEPEEKPKTIVDDFLEGFGLK